MSRARRADTAVEASWDWLTPKAEASLRFHAARIGFAAGLDADDLFQEAVLHMAVRSGKPACKDAVLKVARQATLANARNSADLLYGDLDELADL